eukprot:CAMPEP_0118867728 /NCGR_PEP_ID=MMETSP1163-20130328/11225_1 /TAXON_ID=124430 /ORGANISM="Phaeomonas parva, Strain CCMP2877" /LENGTH=78 /DNA_ID=CAMNT_0006802171 /DNA_START=461 /DNA_END=694 /DNA_ORIENTATION=+
MEGGFVKKSKSSPVWLPLWLQSRGAGMNAGYCAEYSTSRRQRNVFSGEDHAKAHLAHADGSRGLTPACVLCDRQDPHT